MTNMLFHFLLYECRRRGRLHRLYSHQLDDFAVADVLLQFGILSLGFLHPEDYTHLREAYEHGNPVAMNRKSGSTTANKTATVDSTLASDVSVV